MDYKTELKAFCEAQVKKNAAPIPVDVAKLLEEPNCIKAISYIDCNELLIDKELQQQIGYAVFPNGCWYVAMRSPMPGVTQEMIDWWFWWQAQDSLRYKMWFPNAHKHIRYDKKDETYFRRPFREFKPNTQYPDEVIGSMRGKLVIEFVYPTILVFCRKQFQTAMLGRLFADM